MTYLWDPQFLCQLWTQMQKRKYMCVKIVSYIYISISFPTDLVIKSRLANKKEGYQFYESVMMFSIKDCKYLTPYRGLQIYQWVDQIQTRSLTPRIMVFNRPKVFYHVIFYHTSHQGNRGKRKEKKRLSYYPKVSSWRV